MNLTQVMGCKGTLGAIDQKIRKLRKNPLLQSILIEDFKEVGTHMIILKKK
jgi:hypothetical protein